MFAEKARPDPVAAVSALPSCTTAGAGFRPMVRRGRHLRAGMPRWPMLLLAAPAGVATWSGWVGLGTMAGFGLVTPLPGISDWQINSAITLPIGVEAYGAYALGAWLSGRSMSAATRRFAAVSAVGSLLLGMAGQITYHLLQTQGWKDHAPVPVVMFVSALPVLVLGLGAALWHMISHDQDAAELSATDNDAALDGRTDSPGLRHEDSRDSGPRIVRDSHEDNSEDTEDTTGEDTDQDSRAGKPGAAAGTAAGRAEQRSGTAPTVRARKSGSVPPADTDKVRSARDVAEQCAREGRPLSRSALRQAGVTGSNEALSALVAKVTTERSQNEEPDP